MQFYSKYIIKNLAVPFFVITVTLVSIIWLSQSLRFIDLIVNKGLDFFTFLYLSSLIIPFLLNIIIPIALFISVLYSYNKLIVDSELIVMKSSGLSKIQLAKPALIVTFFVTLFSYMISLYLQPFTYREFKDTQFFVRNNYASLLLQEGVFNTPMNGLTVYIDERAGSGLLKGIMVYDIRDVENPVTMTAKQGSLVRTDSGPKFNLMMGSRQEINKKTRNLSILHFDSYDVDLSVYVKEEGYRWREPQERYLNELFNPKNTAPFLINKLKAAGHQRIIWPLYNIALVLIAVLAMLSGDFNRRGQWKRILASSGVTLILLISAFGLQNLAARNIHFVFLMYFMSIFPILFSLYAILDESFFVKTQSLFQKLVPKKSAKVRKT